MKDSIEAINIIFENGDNVFLDNKDLKDFCIANLDEFGNEIPYEETIIKDKLYANFLLLNINNSLIDSNKIKRIKYKCDIIEIMVIFSNKKYVKFVLASNAEPFTSYYHNDYEYVYENSNTFGLLLSEYKIKYKDNLFI